MHQMYELVQATPLKLLFVSTPEPGVGRHDGKEVIPTTETILDQIGLDNNTKERLLKAQKTLSSFNINNTNFNKLRNYQKEDAIFLASHKSGGCFNEQRTGKTPTSLLSLELKGCKKILIVCPSSMVLPWKEAFESWTGRPCIALTGTVAKRTKLLTAWTDGLVIGYESLRIVDHYDKNGNYTNSTGDLGLVLRHKNIEAVILDEAHRIRNYKTKTADAAFKLNKIPNRLALTGTPTTGKQEEIFSILHFLYPKIFTSYWRFIDYYFTKEYTEIYTNRGCKQRTDIGPLRKPKELQQFLDAISTQRKRKEVMSWLPEKDRQTIHFDLTEAQHKYITELRKYFEITGSDIITAGPLDTMIRERQICLSPALLGLTGVSPKIDWIKQYLSDYPDKSIIIFSKFTQWLELLQKEIGGEIISGKVTKLERERLKKEFQCAKLKLLLIQVDAGKEGLTLDRADVTIFTDKFPPVGDIEQAEDRFVATTEDRKDKEHTIYTLVMKNSYEMNIDAGLDKRASELDLINDYRKYLKGGD